jgi:hypothetical protein
MHELFDLLQTDINLTTAIAAVASALAAVLAVLVSLASVVISVWSANTQRKHNQLSVRPIAEVTVADYEDSLKIRLRNNGTGPMTVVTLSVTDGRDTKETLISWMPKLPECRPWNNFSNTLNGRTISAGAEITLLELTEEEFEVDFPKCRNQVRAALCKLSVSVNYIDIYRTKMDNYQRDLTWFGRNLRQEI